MILFIILQSNVRDRDWNLLRWFLLGNGVGELRVPTGYVEISRL